MTLEVVGKDGPNRKEMNMRAILLSCLVALVSLTAAAPLKASVADASDSDSQWWPLPEWDDESS